MASKYLKTVTAILGTIKVFSGAAKDFESLRRTQNCRKEERRSLNSCRYTNNQQGPIPTASMASRKNSNQERFFNG